MPRLVVFVYFGSVLCSCEHWTIIYIYIMIFMFIHEVRSFLDTLTVTAFYTCTCDRFIVVNRSSPRSFPRVFDAFLQPWVPNTVGRVTRP
jgi:hypothetical protein